MMNKKKSIKFELSILWLIAFFKIFIVSAIFSGIIIATLNYQGLLILSIIILVLIVLTILIKTILKHRSYLRNV